MLKILKKTRLKHTNKEKHVRSIRNIHISKDVEYLSDPVNSRNILP